MKAISNAFRQICKGALALVVTFIIISILSSCGYTKKLDRNMKSNYQIHREQRMDMRKAHHTKKLKNL